MRRLLVCLGGVLLAVAMVAPAQASASCGAIDPLVGWQLAVRLSHGYCLTVTPGESSPFGGGPILIVQTTKGSLATGLTRVEYKPRSATWSEQWKSLAFARIFNSMSVDLGERGRISVRFYAKRTARLAPSGGCAGQPGSELLGVWKGVIAFTGEHRYATVRTRSTPGAVILRAARPSNPGCGEPHTVAFSDIPGSPNGAASFLQATGAGGIATFQAFMAQEGASVEFKAEAARHGHEAGCLAQRLAPLSDFVTSSDLNWSTQTPPSSATLTPPAPFQGTGSYANGTITGTIALYCPNLQRYVPLASPAPASWNIFP